MRWNSRMGLGLVGAIAAAVVAIIVAIGFMNERDQFKALLELRTIALDKANTEIAALSGAHDQLTGVVETGAAALKDATAKIATLEGEHDQQAAALKDATAKIATLEGDHNQQTAALKDATAKFAALVGDRDQLASALKDATAKIASLEGDRDQQAAALKGAAATIASLESERDQEEIMLKNEDAKIAMMEAELERLAGVRSQFFAGLNEIVGKRAGMREAGDRFVFDAKVFFAAGSASLDAVGRQQVIDVAAAIRALQAQIPASMKWVVQVNGYTDTKPINRRGRFASNWELSTARAISVVELLRDQGVSPDHLAAAGFSEYQPPADDGADLLAQSRRVEMKLTDTGS